MTARGWAGFVACGLVAGASTTGCARRTIEVTSDPPGAMVWVNDVQIGRTPARASFVYYGDYSVRLDLPGFEPVDTHRKATPPIYEHPPLDLAAEAVGARTTRRWHFVLVPSPAALDPEAEAALISRAREQRAVVEGESR